MILPSDDEMVAAKILVRFVLVSLHSFIRPSLSAKVCTWISWIFRPRSIETCNKYTRDTETSNGNLSFISRAEISGTTFLVLTWATLCFREVIISGTPRHRNRSDETKLRIMGHEISVYRCIGLISQKLQIHGV